MPSRTRRVELEESAVALTPTTFARHLRLFGREEEVLVRQQTIKVARERRGERGQRTRHDTRPFLERIRTEHQFCDPDDPSRHCTSVAISPRRSMRTNWSFRESPCTPRA